MCEERTCAKCQRTLPFPTVEGKPWWKLSAVLGVMLKLTNAQETEAYNNDVGVELCPDCYEKLMEYYLNRGNDDEQNPEE